MPGGGFAAPPPAQTILHQARERTQLVAECARLVRRLEQLEAEISDFSEWQSQGGHPTGEYRSRVQRRFDEARARESLENGGSPRWASTSPKLQGRASARWRPSENASATLPFEPRPPVQSARGDAAANDAGSWSSSALVSLSHLRKALEVVDQEAGLWRKRAQDLEVQVADERERVDALVTASQDRAKLVAQLHDHDNMVEHLESENRALRCENDRQRQELIDARIAAGAQAEEQRQLRCALKLRETDMKLKEVELENLRRELQDFRDVHRICEAKQAQLDLLQTDLNRRKADIDTLRNSFEKVKADVDARDCIVVELRKELEVSKSLYHQEIEATTAAERKSDLLQAKCDNLEAALTNASGRQADAARESKVQKERADRLEEVSRRLLKDIDIGGALHKAKAPYSPASTAVPPEESMQSTPKTPALPPVRPSSPTWPTAAPEIARDLS